MSRPSRRDVQLDQVFFALSDYRRRRVLKRLTRGPLIIKEIGAEFELSKPAVGKHVAILEQAGLIHRIEEGRTHRCEINPKALVSVEGWLTYYREYWSGTLDSLASYAKTIAKKP